MRRTDHPGLKLNFDYSHFFVQGMALQHCVDLCLPHAVHIHIKDGAMADGRVQFLLPGQGRLDLAAYLKTLTRAGLAVSVTVEVSAMIWKAPDYDPWTAATFCYRAMQEARRAAGV